MSKNNKKVTVGKCSYCEKDLTFYMPDYAYRNWRDGVPLLRAWGRECYEYHDQTEYFQSAFHMVINGTHHECAIAQYGV